MFPVQSDSSSPSVVECSLGKKYVSITEKGESVNGLGKACLDFFVLSETTFQTLWGYHIF